MRNFGCVVYGCMVYCLSQVDCVIRYHITFLSPLALAIRRGIDYFERDVIDFLLLSRNDSSL